MSTHRLLLVSAVVAALAACSGPTPPAATVAPSQVAAGASAAQTVADAAQAQLASLDDATLRSRASAALAGQQVYTPAGASAFDYFLALRDKVPADASTSATLAELMPYVLIGAEQAIARNDVAEGARLLALMARVDAGAPALPRLRTELAQARQDATQALADSAKAAVLARETAEAERAQQATSAADAERLRLATAVASRAAPPMPAAAAVATPAPGAAAPSARMATPMASAPAATQTVAVATSPSAATAAAPVNVAPAQAGRTPRLLSDAAPKYPRLALSRKIEGSVQLGFTIQPDGSVGGVRVTSSNPSGVFDEAAVAAASRWRFEASGQAHQSGRTLSFRLPNGS